MKQCANCGRQMRQPHSYGNTKYCCENCKNETNERKKWNLMDTRPVKEFCALTINGPVHYGSMVVSKRCK